MFAHHSTGICRLFVLACVVAALVAAASPASAQAAYIGWYDYDRNNSNTNGTLYFKWTVDDNPPVYSHSWRGGSGIYADDRKNGGWAPSGWYSIRGHWNNYVGTAIWGRVWRLSDKYNSDGVLRTELFIHTEETSSNGQSSTNEAQRWDGASDYTSMGCVKIAYGSHLDSMHYDWTHRGGSSAHGSGSPYPLPSKLYVHN